MSEDIISASDLPIINSTPRERGKTTRQVEEEAKVKKGMAESQSLTGPGPAEQSNPAQVIGLNELSQGGTAEEQAGAKRILEDRKEAVPGVPNPGEQSNPAQVIDLNKLTQSDDPKISAVAKELLRLRSGK